MKYKLLALDMDGTLLNSQKKILPKVFAAGDVIKPGRLTDAIGDARLTALMMNQFLLGEKISPLLAKKIIPQDNLSKKFFDCFRLCGRLYDDEF